MRRDLRNFLIIAAALVVVTILSGLLSRCIARRWPAGRPVIGGPKAMTATGGIPLSRNEA
nr:hypothetical protein [uncultured Sphingomonas sp.]